MKERTGHLDRVVRRSQTGASKRCGQRRDVAADDAGERGSVVGAADGSGAFGGDEVRKGATEREQAIVENVPGDARRLRQHLHRGFGVADALVVKPSSQRIDLDAAFHHQGPGDEHSVRHRPRAVSLIAAEIGELRTERPAPRDRAAVVADMACEHRVAHLRQPIAHHRGIAAEAVAREDHTAAGEMLHGVVGAPNAEPEHAILGIDPELAYQRLGQQRCTGSLRGRVERRDQCSPGALRQRVHAAHRVARIEEAVEQLERETVATFERVDCRADGLGVRRNQVRRCAAVRLALDVGREAFDAVVGHPCGALDARSGGGDEAGAQCRAALRRGVALEQDALDAGIAQHQRGRQPARAGADDRHRHRRRAGRHRGGADHARGMRH